MGYLFGIDGGGTRSRMRIAHENGAMICRCEGESTNMYSVGREAAFAHLRALMEQTCQKANVAMKDMTAGCIGSAGLDRPDERRDYAAFFGELVSCPVKLCNDGEILLVGGLRSMEGYCLIGGTGSLALARRQNGDMIRAGGLGYMLGDEGSACWIGWQAVCRTLRSLEERDLPTHMLPKLLSYFQLDDPRNFVALMHHHFDKPTVGAAAEMVCGMAETGDPLALDICEKAADELCLLVESVAKRMPLAGAKLTLSGGVVEHSKLVRERLIALISQKTSLCICDHAGSAEEGAVMLAATLLE